MTVRLITTTDAYIHRIDRWIESRSISMSTVPYFGQVTDSNGDEPSIWSTYFKDTNCYKIPNSFENKVCLVKGLGLIHK